MDSAKRTPVDESGKSAISPLISPPSPRFSVWSPLTDSAGKQYYICLACDDRRLWEKKNRGQHERGEHHQHKASLFNLRRSRPLVPIDEDDPQRRILLNATRHLVHSLAHRPGEQSSHSRLEPAPAPIPPDWGLDELDVYPTAEEEALAHVREQAADLERFILLASDDEPEGDISEEELEDEQETWGMGPIGAYDQGITTVAYSYERC